MLTPAAKLDALLDGTADADLLPALCQACEDRACAGDRHLDAISRLAAAVRALAVIEAGTPEHRLATERAMAVAAQCDALTRAEAAAWQRVEAITAAIYRPGPRPARDS